MFPELLAYRIDVCNLNVHVVQGEISEDQTSNSEGSFKLEDSTVVTVGKATFFQPVCVAPTTKARARG